MYYKYGRIKSVEDVKTGIKLLRGVPLGDTLFGSILSKRVKKEPKNVRPHLVLHTKTNEFALGSPQGTISSYYKPKEGIDYWFKQIRDFK